MGSLQRILGDLRKGGEGEDALRDFVELEVRLPAPPEHAVAGSLAGRSLDRR